jgi:hypothetical protein
MALYLKEHLSFDRAEMMVESVKEGDSNLKTLYMKGIFIQGGVKNANERVYPVSEIKDAVDTLNEQIQEGNSVLGEVDHPDDLKINLDRVSHMITNMWMDGPNSRGSGNVNDLDGRVSDFEIITVDIVAQPSAPNAYPKAIYEGLMNMTNGHKVLEVAREARGNKQVERFLKDEVIRLIKDLKID